MQKKRMSSNGIKFQNRQKIYQYIRSEGSASKQDLAFGLKLSLPTVTQNLQYLEERGLIDTSRKVTNTGGRNATAYSYIKGARMAIGVYTTPNHINAVVVDLSGNVIEKCRKRIKFDLKADRYLKQIGAIVEQVKESAGLSDEGLLGVGIAVPGLVSDDGEEVDYGMTLNFRGVTRAEIAKYIPYRTRLFHDSFVAGYAEVWIDHRVKDAFYISLNNSVGGAIVIGNEIFPGDTNKSGEIGHMVIDAKSKKKCYCGRYGCLDTVCNAGNLDQYTDGNLEEFFRLIDEGDQKAWKLWDEYLDYLALAIHNIRMLFNSVVIIGGYVGAYIGDCMEDLKKRVDAWNSIGDLAEDYLIPCKYKVEATAAGAAIIFIDEFIENV